MINVKVFDAYTSIQSTSCKVRTQILLNIAPTKTQHTCYNSKLIPELTFTSTCITCICFYRNDKRKKNEFTILSKESSKTTPLRSVDCKRKISFISKIS